jgi:hypothetical protein
VPSIQCADEDTGCTVQARASYLPRSRGVPQRMAFLSGQRKCMVKEGNRRVRPRKMSPDLLSKLSWAPRKFVCRCVCTSIYKLSVNGYVPVTCWEKDGRDGRKTGCFRNS